MKIIEREGRIKMKYQFPEDPIKQDLDKYIENVLEVEKELNGKTANEIYKKYGLAMRFHL